MTETVQSAGQKLSVGKFIELFSLDTTPLGGGLLLWTPARPEIGGSISFQGNVYTAVDIETSGFEKNTSGTLPRPQLSVSNADDILGSLLIEYGDALGLVITRTKTLGEFLDGEPGADPDQYWPTDVYKIERKVTQNKNIVVMELSTATDNAGAKIPARIVQRDFCSQIYRCFASGDFDYTRATCPYVGTKYFDVNGNPVTSAASDVCGKKLSDCRLRFGTAQLPFGGFPGVSRVRLP